MASLYHCFGGWMRRNRLQLSWPNHKQKPPLSNVWGEEILPDWRLTRPYVLDRRSYWSQVCLLPVMVLLQRTGLCKQNNQQAGQRGHHKILWITSLRWKTPKLFYSLVLRVCFFFFFLNKKIFQTGPESARILQMWKMCFAVWHFHVSVTCKVTRAALNCTFWPHFPEFNSTISYRNSEICGIIPSYIGIELISDKFISLCNTWCD